MSYDCTYKQKTVQFTVKNEKFVCEGKTIVKPGFTAVMDWLTIDQGDSLPHLIEGQTCDIKEVGKLQNV